MQQSEESLILGKRSKEPKRAAVARLCGMTAHALTRQVRTGGQTDGSRTHIASRGSSHIERITAIHPSGDAARETPYRNSGAIKGMFLTQRRSKTEAAFITENIDRYTTQSQHYINRAMQA